MVMLYMYSKGWFKVKKKSLPSVSVADGTRSNDINF